VQALLKQIKEIKPYSLPDPALKQPELPLSNVVIVTHSDRESLEEYKSEWSYLLVGHFAALQSRMYCILEMWLKCKQGWGQTTSYVSREWEGCRV